jgi:hypothetical protein
MIYVSSYPYICSWKKQFYLQYYCPSFSQDKDRHKPNIFLCCSQLTVVSKNNDIYRLENMFIRYIKKDMTAGRKNKQDFHSFVHVIKCQMKKKKKKENSIEK